MSIVFYAWNKPLFTLILLSNIVLNFIGALVIEKVKVDLLKVLLNRKCMKYEEIT